MLTIKEFLAPPVFPGDEEKTHQAFILHVIILGMILVPIPYVLYTLLADSVSTPRALAESGFGEAVNLFTLFLMRRGRTRLASVILVAGLWLLFTLVAIDGSGVRGQAYLLGYGLCIVISGALMGGWGAVATTIASLASGAVMVLAETNGWLFRPFDSPLAYWIISLALFPPSALVQNLAARAMRQALERTHLSQAQYRSLIEESPEGIFIVDEQRQIVIANPMAREILGYAPGEMNGMDPSKLFDRTDLAQRPFNMTALMEGGTLRQERVFIRKDGSRVPIFGSIKRMPDGRYQITFQDISERKKIEQEANRHANELQALYQASLDINAQIDMTALLQAIAKHAAHLLGMERGSIYLLQPDQTLELVIQFNVPSSYQGIRLKIGEGVAGRVVQSGEPVMIADYRNWEHRATVFDATPTRRVLGVPLRTRNHIIGSLNVTDSDQVGLFGEDQVRLLCLFADQAAIAIENGRLYEQTHQRAEVLTTMNEIGRAVSALQDLNRVLEVVYRHIQRLVPVDAFYISLYDAEHEQISFPIMYDLGMRYEEPTLPLRPDSWIAQVISTGIPYVLHRGEKELEQPLDGAIGDMTRKSASILIVPLWVGARTIGVMSVQSYTLNAYTDEHAEILTSVGHQVAIAIENAKLFSAAQQELQERRRVETERELLIKELEAKNAELERFTYTVSHDLKSPLITMRGFLGYLEQDAQSGDHSRFRADLNRIVRATNKMQQLLNELLELSRIGRMMNPPEALPFESIAHEAVSLVEGRISECGAKVSIEFGMPQVSGDRVRLVEVVQNLVDNAIKFMGDQPQPLVEIGMRGSDADGKTIFFVRDNGIGIDPQYHERVFGLFNKLNVETEGTGIGLALVKRIVEIHNGRIWVESEGLGKGTTFCFTLATVPS